MAGMAPRAIDCFVSYTGADVAWAKWCVAVLEVAGYSTVTQVYDFRPGESFIGNMHEALRRSERTLALLSPDYLKSKYCTMEWQAALKEERLVPVRVRECDVGGLLGPIAYETLHGIDEARARAALLAALARAKTTARSPSPFPGQPARFPGVMPAVNNITIQRNPHFSGRDAVLARLHERLGSGEPAALTQHLSGLGGVGKTQLALEYAYRYSAEHDAILWLHAEQPAVLGSQYAALASLLGLPEVQDQARAVEQVRKELSARARTLVIFDNAADEASLAPYMPLGAQRRVLICSRANHFHGAAREPVREMTTDEAVAFLLVRTQTTDAAAACEVAQRLGNLPLALEQAAAYVLECACSLADYAKLLAVHGLEILEEGRAHDYPATVAVTWSAALERLQAEPGAAALLRLCAFLAPDDIPLADLATVADGLPEPLASTLRDPRKRNAAKRALLAYSLVDVQLEDRLSVHRLVQEVTRTGLDPAYRSALTQQAVEVMLQLFPKDAHEFGREKWERCSRFVAHASAALEHAKRESLATSKVSTLASEVASYYYARADWQQAETLWRRALAIDEASFGPGHPNVAMRLNDLAQVLHAANRLPDAEALMLRALAIDEASLGPEDPELAIHLNNMAGLLQTMHRLSEAEPLLRRALAIDEASFGPEHPNVAIRLNNLAGLLQAKDRLSEAEPLSRRALAIDEASLGREHPDVAIRLNNLAQLLQATHRLLEAEPLMRRALAIEESSLGPEHPNIATVLTNLGTLLLAMKRGSEAEPLMRRALAIDEVSLGPQHPSVAEDLSNLAQLLKATSRLPEAEPLMRQALAIDDASLGATHPRVATDLNNLALLLKANNKLSEAEPLMRRALAIMEASYGVEHRDTRTAAANLSVLEAELARA